MPKDEAFTAHHPSLSAREDPLSNAHRIPQKSGGTVGGKMARSQEPAVHKNRRGRSLVPIEASGAKTGNSPPNQPQIPARKAGGRRGDHGRPPPRILRAPAHPRFQRWGDGCGESWAGKAEAICTNAGLQFGEGEAGGRNK